MFRNKVFRVADRIRDRKALIPRLVFKIKHDIDREIEKRKVRLVIRGFEQIEGIDYNQTFITVVKANT